MTPTDIRDTAIPEDVMLTAMKVANTVLRNLDPDDVTYEVKAIARAIMAATEAERERCAKICEEDNVNWKSGWHQTNAGLYYARLISSTPNQETRP